MTLQDLEHHLRSLSPDEQANAIYLLVQSLGNPWRRIEKTPGVCGGRVNDLANAWIYAAAHPEEIETAIQANEAA
jgi:hypothetical protein